MPTADFTLPQLAEWGEALGGRIEPPCLVTLDGDLGAGKTTLAQAIARGYGVRETITSPTFAIVHQYRAPRSAVFHLDLYRLSGAEQLANIGWDDALAARALVMIEWPGRAAGQLPSPGYAITLAHVPGEPDVRRVGW